MNNLYSNHLKVLYKFSPLITEVRRRKIIDYFSFKTNKVQIIFENLSNPLNAVIYTIT